MGTSISRLPALVMRMPGMMPAQSNREVIIDYLISQEGTIALTDLQQELLTRWNTADDLMRSFRYSTREVAQQLVKKFNRPEHSYSISTAWRDIEDARYVYGNSRSANKRYLVALHVERIEHAIALAQQMGKRELLIKLFEVHTNALKLLPDDSEKKQSPAAIVFNVGLAQFNMISPDQMLTMEEAIEVAAQELAKNKIGIEDILHEDVN